MKVIRKITSSFDVKYVNCLIQVSHLDECSINGVGSPIQTLKKLPFLVSEYSGFYWNPKINLETGEVLNWPKGMFAEIYFDAKYCEFTYLEEDMTPVFTSVINEVPKYLQLDLVERENGINIMINQNGFIENWPNQNVITESII